MRPLKAASVLAVVTLLLTSCGGDGNGDADNADAAACENAVIEVAEAVDMQDDREQLQPAFDACQELAEFRDAVENSPEALEEVGDDIEAYVEEQCQDVEALRDTALCQSLTQDG